MCYYNYVICTFLQMLTCLICINYIEKKEIIINYFNIIFLCIFNKFLEIFLYKFSTDFVFF